MENTKSKEMDEKKTKNAEMSDAVITVMDKLAGKQSDLKLHFQDLTLDIGMTRIKLNGTILLDVLYSKESKTQAM